MLEPVTLAHVAQEAGVSPSTVSRILNGTANVTPEKRARVEAVIARLNFRPNPQAQALANGRSLSIGVITPSLNSTFYGEALAGVEAVLNDTPYHPLVISGQWRPEREQEALDILLLRRVDALILMGGILDDAILERVAQRVPLVAMGRDVRGLSENCIVMDNAGGMRVIVTHLLHLGHRRFAYLTGAERQQDAVERRDAFIATLEQAGVTVPDALIESGDYTEEGGRLAAERLLDSGHSFTALCCANDQMALGARLTLYRRGIRVPEDVSLTGFDDVITSSLMTPPLTTVRQAIYDMGEVAARAALNLLRGERVSMQVFTPELIVRESTHPPGGARRLTRPSEVSL
ncbi:LacI family transcriptional regulator [Deinococcus metalli]|uniref:LacI family transcriptional regulator n=1 Tax=Deinococcus metalli TaxID=1141878 RepID=A0A7W8KGN7_9DEIO|nr:LacI family DNA-binding transcriptional regulator [Deinococcus metalli]MBB5377458.1 LacI family transcriptional regulator [Deinococcus metalli]GHF50572.1 LacI family transcriptional regulator [Deinococcus metalli]